MSHLNSGPPFDRDALLSRAKTSLAAGDVAEARRSAGAILERAPHDASALLVRGMAELGAGDLDAAVRSFDEVLTADPTNRQAIFLVASVAWRQGNMALAEKCCKALVKLNPDDGKAQNNLGLCYLAQDKLAQSIPHFERATRLDQGDASFQHNLGLAYERSNRIADAEQCYRAAIRINPAAADSLFSLAQLLVVRGDAAAGAYLKRVYEAERDTVRGLTSLAYSHFLLDSTLEKAEEVVQLALAKDQSYSPTHALLAMIQHQQGHIELGNQSLQRAIDLEPDQPGPYWELVFHKKIQDADRPLLAQIQSKLDQPNRTHVDRRMFEFCLGKAYDDLHEYEQAMAHYHAAHEASRHIDARKFDQERFSAEVDRNIELFPLVSMSARTALRGLAESLDSPLNLDPSPNGGGQGGGQSEPEKVQFRTAESSAQSRAIRGSESERPIFIVGMFRSGTTLVEQLLSSHAEIAAAGELVFWPEKSALALESAVLNPNQERLSALADEYLAILEKAGAEARFVTDKHPENYQRIGLLHAVYPNAKFIYCRRKPIDNALSLYMTYFAKPPLYTSTPRDIVFAYREHERLMAHWKKSIPADRLIEVRYEEMIADFEGVARRLLEFLDLPWDDACLHPEQNQRVVRTASQWQVRQPLYVSSVDRWRNYEPYLGDFRALLEDAQ